MDNLLKTWISESESWQTYIDFQLPEEDRAAYPFLKRTDDFYLSLMHRSLLALKTGEYNNHSEELLALAKGLEIYSLKKKRNNFTGVNQSNNILFASAFYYFSNYSASAWILSNIYTFEDYKSDIDIFISSFLKRSLNSKISFNSELQEFLVTGNFEILKNLNSVFDKLSELSFKSNSYDYSSFLLGIAIIKKFSTDNIWYDLLKYKNDVEFWRPIVNQYIKKKVPVWSFFPSQKEALNKNILNGRTFSLQMPTSSGKTSLSEIIIYNEIKSGRSKKILYLAPFRALASELKLSLAFNLAPLGIKSKTIYGGNIPSVEERNSIQDVQLLIATPEKFMAIEDIFTDIHKEFDTIICDEGHLLDDNSRGLSYELLLSRLKEDETHNKKFIFISAIIPNLNVINTWLGGDVNTLVTSDYRPTELDFAFLKKMNGRTLGYYLDINPTKNQPQNYQLYRYLYGNELKLTNPANNRKVAISTKSGISAAVSIKATKSGSVALFAPHKRGNTGVEGLSTEIIRQLVWSGNLSLLESLEQDFIESLVEYFSKLFGKDYLLVKAISLGFLYHHGDFPQGIREIIEDSLRSGNIKLVVCTNTLAEGVNLPLKTIVIHSTKRFNPDVIGNYENLKIRDLKNLVGRAGRAGKETKGLIIIPHAVDFELITRLINETEIEPVKGQLYNIINSITKALQKHRLQLSSEILDLLDDNFQSLLDSIDLSMIDLLAEEIDNDSLSDLIKQLISQTLSYYQSDNNEKETLSSIFLIRAEKLRPYIDNGEFKTLKSSGTTLRLYDDIKKNIDFEDIVWTQSFSSQDSIWLDYILDKCLFNLEHFKKSLAQFNQNNNCEVNSYQIREAIILWMSGNWFHEIAEKLNLQIHQVLRLINSFMSFNVQSYISTIIRLKDLKEEELTMPVTITNWPSFLQYGISNQHELDLFEMGLIDREAVLCLSAVLTTIDFSYIDYSNLKTFLIENRKVIIDYLLITTPKISLNNIVKFMNLLKIKEII